MPALERHKTRYELLRVGDQSFHCSIHPHQISQVEDVWLLDRDEAPGPAARVPAKGEMAFEGTGGKRLLQPLCESPLRELQHPLQTLDQLAEATHRAG